MVTFKGTHHSLTSAEIAQVEANLGFRLPDEFYKHYLRYNGGRPTPGCFKKDGEWYCVEDFFPLNEKIAGNSFEEIYRVVLLTPEFPGNFVPFASDDGGNCYVFSARNDDFGTIYLSQQDYFNDPDRCVVFIADTLDSFLAALTNHAD